MLDMLVIAPHLTKTTQLPMLVPDFPWLLSRVASWSAVGTPKFKAARIAVDDQPITIVTD